jgi:hypothetical protein
MLAFFIVSNLPLPIVVSHRGFQKELLSYYCYNYVDTSGYYFMFCCEESPTPCWVENVVASAVVAVQRVASERCVTD